MLRSPRDQPCSPHDLRKSSVPPFVPGIGSNPWLLGNRRGNSKTAGAEQAPAKQSPPKVGTASTSGLELSGPKVSVGKVVLRAKMVSPERLEVARGEES